MTIIQLYAHIKDLTPMEALEQCKGFKTFTNPVDSELHHLTNPYEQIKEDIKANDIKYALNILPNGDIMDGNMRYHIAKELVIKYLPINIKYLTGLIFIPRQEMISNRQDIYQLAEGSVTNEKQKVINK